MFLKITINVVCFFFMFLMHCNGQNLVPNSGFEIKNDCPIDINISWSGAITFSADYSYFPFVAGWVSPLLRTTPDYFNSCDSIGRIFGVPRNFMGYRQAHGGNAYAGIITFHVPYDTTSVDSAYSEYLECRLLQPLKKDKKYTVTFYVLNAMGARQYDNQLIGITKNIVAIDKIGVFFSDTLVIDSSTNSYVENLYLPYHISNSANNFIEDTLNWVKVSGTYTAHGGEEWMILGTFYGSDNPQRKLTFTDTNILGTTHINTYYLIDDISVIEKQCDTLSNITDTAVCEFATFKIKSSQEGFENYNWSTGDITSSIDITQFGQYTCIATKGCNLIYDTITVSKVDTCNRSSTQDCFLIPSAFSPNNDGLNDNFSLVSHCLVFKFEISIYNRWGNRVFNSNSINNKWDGRFNGKELDVGTYFYLIQYRKNNDRITKSIKGDVTLIR